MTQPIPYHSYPQAGPWDADLSHLKTLSICHYVWGALTILFSSIFIVHIVMGVAMLNNPDFFAPASPSGPTAATTQPQATPPPPPAFLGWMFVGMGSCAILFGWTMGVLTIVSGRFLARRKNRLFSLIMAGVNCMSVPIGTTLGVFTFVVLLRPSVRALYDQGEPAAAAG
jgi:hypothetical protein